MSESSKTNKPIQDYLESEGGYVVKTIATNKAGVHDIIACLDGRFLSIEGKLDDNIASILQGSHSKKVYAAGGFTMLAYSLLEVKVAIKAWRKAGYPPTRLGRFKSPTRIDL